MEGLAHQQEERERRQSLEESLIADRNADMDQFASPDFVQQVKETELTENDKKMVSTMLQRVC